jgi:amylosucrase
MYQHDLHQKINLLIQQSEIDLADKDNLFYTRFIADAAAIHALYMDLYTHHSQRDAMFDELLQTIVIAYKKRAGAFKQKDEEKLKKGFWFLSNEIAGMSLYVDRFCGSLQNLGNKLDYFEKLGVNLLHLMPLFESPQGESDGGYAVSDFRTVDERFGSLDDLKSLEEKMNAEGMYLMIDIVLNHTSHHHKWAKKAKQGETKYQDYYYMYADRVIPDEFDTTMPEIFPESAPGNFTYVEECKKWVMTVFHQYQWDLNYTNPEVFVEMLDNIFFYANLGVDILRIDAPAFIWKQLGTASQNLPQAHTILQLIKQCVNVATPGMALLGEAIVSPQEIMKYFGTGLATAKECDLAYNATQMALQWDAMATGDTRVMLAAQNEILQKPYGTSWITYTRCHDDIGLGYTDAMIEQSGYNAYDHRRFLKEYYSGNYYGSPAKGALFGVNPKTQDARISGSLASLCGLEKAIEADNEGEIKTSIKKILLMQALSFFLGGLPMMFYGDEVGYTNDYSYLNDESKSYDNRWMHRPVIDWEKNKKIEIEGTIEKEIFSSTQKLIGLRKKTIATGDYKNIMWLSPHNIHVAGFIREHKDQKLYCLFNFCDRAAFVTWYIFKEHGLVSHSLYEHWSNKNFLISEDHEYLIMQPYDFYILEMV